MLTTLIKPIWNVSDNTVKLSATTPREALDTVRQAFPNLANRNLIARRTGDSTFEVMA